MCVRSILCNCCSLLTTRWSCNLANDMQSVYERHWRLIGRNEKDSDVRNKSFIEEDITGCNNPFTFATKSTSTVFESHLLSYIVYSTSITFTSMLSLNWW